MYEQSHRDYLRSGYLHHRLPVMQAVNHYRDNAITYKAQRQKCQRTEAGERGNIDMQMRQRDVAALDANNNEGVSRWGLKMMLCVMMSLVVVGYDIKAVRQSVREATTASGVDNAASPTGRHR